MIFKRLFFFPIFFLAFTCIIIAAHGMAHRKALINGSGHKMYIDAHNNISETREKGLLIAIVFAHIKSEPIIDNPFKFEQGNPKDEYYNSVTLLCGNNMATPDQQVAITTFCDNYTPMPTDLDASNDFFALFAQQINLFASPQKNCVYLLDEYGQKMTVGEDQDVITLRSAQSKYENNDCSIVLFCGNHAATQKEQEAITNFVLYNNQKNVFFDKQLQLMKTGLNICNKNIYQSTPYAFDENKKPMFRKKSPLSQVQLEQVELE